MSEEGKVDQSKTFCVYPWLEQTIQPTGKVSFCCVGKHGGSVDKADGSPFAAGADKLTDAWNSDFMRDMRQKMVAGEKHPKCSTCYYQESIGKKSYRQMHNEEWMNKIPREIMSRVEESRANDFKLNTPPVYLDLRLGNVCNLKCRMCNPFNSSKIYGETVKMYKQNPEFRNFWEEENGPNPPAPTPRWFEDEGFWDEVIASIPHLKKVYLTGGEPTLIENNYRFLNECVRQGYAKNIFLMFNINCTNVQDRFLDLIKHFKFVLINVSLDGYNQVNEYIRSSSNWELVENNFKRLLASPGNVQIGVTPVVQSYNVLDITDLTGFVEYCHKETGRNINVDFLYCLSPKYLAASNLPRRIRLKAAERLREFRKHSVLYETQFYMKNSVDSCITMLEQEDDGDPRMVERFLLYTRMLDRERDQRMPEVLPELTEMLQQEGLAYA